MFLCLFCFVFHVFSVRWYVLVHFWRISMRFQVVSERLLQKFINRTTFAQTNSIWDEHMSIFISSFFHGRQGRTRKSRFRDSSHACASYERGTVENPEDIALQNHGTKRTFGTETDQHGVHATRKRTTVVAQKKLVRAFRWCDVVEESLPTQQIIRGTCDPCAVVRPCSPMGAKMLRQHMVQRRLHALATAVALQNGLQMAQSKRIHRESRVMNWSPELL